MPTLFDNLLICIFESRKKTESTIKKENGDIAIEKHEVKARWMQYTQELYNDDRADYNFE